MIVGSGIDLVEIERIQQSVERFGSRFLNRIYTDAEQAYCLRKKRAAESLAARFAAKEAGAKALGTGISRGVTWLEIEVVREPGDGRRCAFTGGPRRWHAGWGQVGPRFRSLIRENSPWPAWSWRTAGSKQGSGILKAIGKEPLPKESCAKSQRDSVVTTESGRLGPGGHCHSDFPRFPDVGFDRRRCSRAS